MTFLLDTNTCIAHLRRPAIGRLERRLSATTPGEVVLCSVVRAELIYGALRSRDPEEALREVETFLEGLPSLPFDDRAADAYGPIRADLAAKGTPIGPNDLMIAAIAVANALTLVTRNVSEFSRVPNLRIEDWESDAV